MKLAIFNLEKWEEEYIFEKLKDKQVKFYKGNLENNKLKEIKDCEMLVVFIHSKIDKKILDQLPNLKFIATMSTGFDHIDLKECRKRGIKVSNVPYYGENTVAEHTFALMLALSRKIFPAIERTKVNDFSLKGLMGFDLKGKTLGVIGPGHIGQHVIRMARAFEMKVIAYSNVVDKKLEKKMGFKYVSLNDLLSSSDIITIHAPLNESTRHMINMNSIKKIKRGALLVNTSRGEIVDTKALIFALDHKILSGAALDVLEGECDITEEKELIDKDISKACDIEKLIQNHILLREKNVVITPHCAFYSKEAVLRILDTTLDNIKSFKNGKWVNRTY